jgi:hypothetical protein
MTAVSQIFTISASLRRHDAVPVDANSRSLLRQVRASQVAELPTGLQWHVDTDEPLDVLRSIDSARLVSTRVKDVVSEFDSGEVSWLPADVRTPSGETPRYWLVHYQRLLQVFDLEATTFGPSGKPIRWVIDLEQVQDLPVFMVPGPIAETFLVHPAVKDALVAAGVTGMDVRRTRT